MEFKYLNNEKIHPLIDHFYLLKINEDDLPFSSLIVPIGHTNITYIFSNQNQIYNIRGNHIELKNLVLTGQIYGHYNVKIPNVSENLGFALKPTALYKILETNISNYNNVHLNLKEVNTKLYEELESIFLKFRNNHSELILAINTFLNNIPLSNDRNIVKIDKAIDYIVENDGLITVNELLEEVALSQKSLETQFRKIVGVTPGKYIKQYRFNSLMRKYQSKKNDLKTLFYQYNYYDQSHFSRDFNFFIGQSPKEFFNKDFPLIEKYLV